MREQKTAGEFRAKVRLCIEPTAMTQVKADEKTKMFLDAYQAQKMSTSVRNTCVATICVCAQRNDATLDG